MLGMKGNRENKQKSIVTYMKIEGSNLIAVLMGRVK